MRALQATTDRKGIQRYAGEEYLVRDLGIYLPTVYEKFISINNAVQITFENALHL